MSVSSIGSLLGSVSSGSNLTTVSSPGKASGFGDAMKAAVQQIDKYQQDANGSIQDFLQGKGELHNVAMATQRAEMAFDLGMQVRNKVVSAYQEIMKMQL